MAVAGARVGAAAAEVRAAARVVEAREAPDRGKVPETPEGGRLRTLETCLAAAAATTPWANERRGRNLGRGHASTRTYEEAPRRLMSEHGGGLAWTQT